MVIGPSYKMDVLIGESVIGRSSNHVMRMDR
jgi:hypothetical protein